MQNSNNKIVIDIFESNKILSGNDFIRVYELDRYSRANWFLGGLIAGDYKKVISDLNELTQEDKAVIDNTTHKASFYCGKTELVELLNLLTSKI